MSIPTNGKVFGLLAEFETPSAVYHACEKVRDAGYKNWDAHTPFPVHGLDKAMGLPPSRLPFLVLGMGLTGASLAFYLQYWVSTVAQPAVISGKPFNSWQAFIPVTFEVGVLFGALGAVFGILHFSKLPRFFNPLFRSTRFERVTDDRFFISIQADDPNYDETTTAELLKSAGAVHVETVED
jgi:hypothetical protein